VLSWRVAASIGWVVLLLPVCTAAFVVLSKINVFHPIQWISDIFFFALIKSKIFFFFWKLGMEMFKQVLFTHLFFAVVPSIPCTRIAMIGKAIHPQQVLHSLVHTVLGLLVAWCTAAMAGGRYQQLTAPCAAEDNRSRSTSHLICLNEYHHFLLLAGAFMGYSYSLLYLVNNMSYLPFPTIQQYKYLRFKGVLPLVIKHSAVQSLYSVRNYCIIYYLIGCIPREWLITSMNLCKDDTTLQSLDSLTGLLDFSLLYQTWLCGTFLLVTWYITWLLFRIFATEVFCFSIQPSFVEEANQCLPKVLSSNPPPIVKFLALQDFALLSQHSFSRRQEVFSLSQPGGHPHNWMAISGECLALLSGLTQRLIAHQEAVAANGRMKPHSSYDEPRKSSSNSAKTCQWPRYSPPPPPAPAPFIKTPLAASLKPTPIAALTPDSGSPFISPIVNRRAVLLDPSSPWYGSVQSPHVMRRGPKLWTSKSGAPMNGSSNVFEPTPVLVRRGPADAEKTNFFSVWFQRKQDQVKTFLAKRVLVMYLFSKHPETSSQALFADSQTHIWALEGLSHLVSASFTEDRFGVVQTTLPSILSTLLTLQEAVDKHFKLPHASSKPARSSGSLVDTSYKTLRFALRASLKTAIYRITSTFGEHLNLSAVHLSLRLQWLTLSLLIFNS
uniref:Nucleoporin NDC1 n=1 Tax=Latimeria chalumnae TaxID=7897 RepID=H3APH5_LATCH